MLSTQIPLLPFFDTREIALDADIGGTQLFEEDWRRIGIVLHNVGSNEVFVRANTPAEVGTGLIVPSTGTPLTLYFKDVGALTTRPWFAIADIMNSGLFGYEIIYTPLLKGDDS